MPPRLNSTQTFGVLAVSRSEIAKHLNEDIKARNIECAYDFLSPTDSRLRNDICNWYVDGVKLINDKNLTPEQKAGAMSALAYYTVKLSFRGSSTETPFSCSF